MSIIDPMIAEFAHEAANTRKMLERVPEKELAWKPHPKSMSLAQLASHIVEIPQWVKPTLDQEELVFDPSTYKPVIYDRVLTMLKAFDDHVADALATMKGRSDAHMMVTWRLKAGSEVVFEAPRAIVLRGMTLNHTAHHRGQLSVYLRLNNVPLPAIYGPSADEQK